MARRITRVTACAIVLAAAVGVGAGEPLRIVTYNIRYDEPSDGPHAWPARRDGVARLIGFHRVDVVGVQEALAHQLHWLEERLPGMKAVGVGREDGVAKGEFTAILYRAERFEAGAHGTFWLSETPEGPGKGWDAAFARIVTWLELTDRRGGERFFVLATHFDHLGVLARRESARLLRRRAAELAGLSPCVVIGDFNATPEEEPVRLLLAADSPLRLFDAVAAAGSRHHGPSRTFGGFDPRAGLSGGRIDHVFVSSGIRVIATAVLTDHDDRGYFSDHLPVLAELAIGGTR